MPDDDCSVGEQLERCIWQKDNGQVVRLLTEMGNREAVKYTTKEGVPLLHVAILSHNNHVARLLLDRGADPSVKNSRGRTALHAAAEANNVGLVVDLLKACSVHALDLDGDTALHVAVQRCSVEMTRWLIFGGADPYLPNKKGLACQRLTNKYIIRRLLRDFSRDRPPLTFDKLDSSKPRYFEALKFSLGLLDESPSGIKTDFLYCAVSDKNLAPEKLGGLQDDEEVMGRVVDYRLGQPVQVSLTFDLLEPLDQYREMVLRALFEESGEQKEEKRDVIMDVTVIDAPISADDDDVDHEAAPVTADTTDVTHPSSSDPPAETSESDVVYLARADCHVALEPSGLLFVMCRPIQQNVSLGKGVSMVRSQVDDRVVLRVPEDCHTQIEGELQLEPSPPVKEEEALVAPSVETRCEFDSQTDFIKLRTADGGKTAPNPADDLSVTVDLPLPEGFNGGELKVYIRTFSQDAIVRRRSEVSVSSSDGGSEDSQSESEVEDELEAQKWTQTINFRLSKNDTCMQVPVKPNKTMTVVETNKKITDEKLKKNVAKQYRKRRDKRALFFVAGRPWSGWRECLEVLVVVTAPAHLSRELGRYLADGYCLLHVSGEFLVPKLTDFRVSVMGDVFVEVGEGEAVITFQHVLHVEQTGNHCAFVLRRKSEHVTQGRFQVEQKRKKTKKTKKGDPLWKRKGELHFDMGAVGEFLRTACKEGEELVKYFSDTLLIDLATKMSEAELPALAKRLGLNPTDVDRVLKNASLKSPVFRCFELLRRQRDRSDNTVTFGRCLVTALKELKCQEQCVWLLQRLRDWPQLKEVKC
ncbi:uncharacterized protein LOC143294975 [Babylonia areolata]|uniref:uncharacterized protein LOC143294975 n=1 Tax=Babylonia areolata TaxID=304850 RepID=UPI003FD2E34E